MSDTTEFLAWLEERSISIGQKRYIAQYVTDMQHELDSALRQRDEWRKLSGALIELMRQNSPEGKGD